MIIKISSAAVWNTSIAACGKECMVLGVNLVRALKKRMLLAMYLIIFLPNITGNLSLCWMNGTVYSIKGLSQKRIKKVTCLF